MEKDKRWMALLVIPAFLGMLLLGFRMIAPYDNERVYYEVFEKNNPNIAEIVEIKAHPYTAYGHVCFELEAKDGHFVRPFYHYTFMLEPSLAETLPEEVTQALEREEEVFLVVETGDKHVIQTIRLKESLHVFHYIRVVIDGILFLLLGAFCMKVLFLFEAPDARPRAKSAPLIQTVYTMRMFSPPKRHNGKCDGDCKNCPPHYGYRYGKWYYGHDHAWGCEFGGNKCSGSMME